MKFKLLNVASVCLGLGFTSVLVTADELPKSGSFEGHFGWLAIGTSHTIYEGRVLFTGQFSGTFFNDAGEGFLHKAAVVCPGSYDFDFNNRVGKAQGFCSITDADGDTAQIEWKCQGDTVECPGTQRWINGTGKYLGISGDHSFNGIIVGQSEHGNSSGYSLWQGDWNLPE